MDRYPHYPGSTDDETSAEAADAMVDSAPILRDKAEAILIRIPSGRSADQIARELGVDKLAIRPRLSELKEMGRAYKTTRRTINDSGKPAAIYIAAKYAASEGIGTGQLVLL